MNVIEHQAWVLEDGRSRTLKILNELSQDDLRWRACATCNSIGSIAIHIGRVEDVLSLGALGLTEQLWQSQGWHQKLGLAEDDWGWGFDNLGQSSQPDLRELVSYLEAVRGRTLPALKAMPSNRLDREVPGRRVRTVAQTLAFILNEELQHLGQIDYIRGMKQALEGSNADSR